MNYFFLFIWYCTAPGHKIQNHLYFISLLVRARAKPNPGIAVDLVMSCVLSVEL